MGEIRIRFLIIFPVKGALDLWVRGKGCSVELTCALGPGLASLELGEGAQVGAWWSQSKVVRSSSQHPREAEKGPAYAS